MIADQKDPSLDMKTAAWRRPEFFLYWLPPLLWAGAILVMSGEMGSSSHTLALLQWLLSSSLSPGQIKAIHFYLRKTGHATAYGILFFLWFRALRGQRRLRPGRAAWLTLGLCLLLAVTDEGHQFLLQSRTGSIWDVCLDLSGSGLTAVLLLVTGWPRPR